MSLSAVAANNALAEAKKLLSAGIDINCPGPDGTIPLCAAALWGNDEMVSLLLEYDADVHGRNEGTMWTALHGASFQEHGKVVKILLENKADPNIADSQGRSPADFASISEGIWPFFAAKGCHRTAKADLIEKCIIRKMQTSSAYTTKPVEEYTRPGSAYIRVNHNPFDGKATTSVGASSGAAQQNIFIDPLAECDSPSSQQKMCGSMRGLGL